MPGNRKRAKRSLDFNADGKSAEEKDNVVDLVPVSTPQKKKKRDLKAYFSSPVATTSTVSESVAIVTPPDAKKAKLESKDVKKKDEKKEAEHVPAYIHKNISYVRKGEAEVDPITQRVYNLVQEHFVIPPGMENNRAYGPKSGVCSEQRVITCYTNNLLKPKGESGEAIEICTHCAVVGHVRDDCQDLI